MPCAAISNIRLVKVSYVLRNNKVFEQQRNAHKYKNYDKGVYLAGGECFFHEEIIAKTIENT